MIANPSSKGTGCGCSGGTLSVSPCGCGGAGCGACQAQGIVRPRFFAGQLLTEDDLQLLTDYVGQKNRLHNRYLFGAGVVCGLEVSCHPCADGRVIVHPGYAIDCCGNDLTLSCAQILDMNAMVRDLRRNALGGFDCVDPCPDPPKSVAEAKEMQDDKKNENNVAKPAFRYCLYVRYCEQPSDPVAPYSTGEECVQVGCEPTRIREGVTFELRCRAEHDASNPLIQRLCACVGDVDKLSDVIKAVKELIPHARVFAYSRRRFEGEFAVDELSQLKTSAKRLADLDRATGITPARKTVEGLSVAETNELLAARQRFDPELINRLGDVAILVNRFDQLPPTKQQELLATAKDPQLPVILNETREKIRITSKNSLASAEKPFNLVRDWLIEQLNKSPFLTNCTLRERVYALVLPRSQEGESKAELTVAADNTDQLIEAFIDYLRDCVCRALNPACLPCEDSGVLLACLELEDCRVMRICNMERSFVLSPAAVKYWVPPFQLLGNLIERFCCVPWSSIPTKDQTKDPDLEKILQEEVVRIIKDSLCGISDQTLDNMLSGLDDLFDGNRSAQRMQTRSSMMASMNTGRTLSSKMQTMAGVQTAASKKRQVVTGAETPTATTQPEVAPPPAAPAVAPPPAAPSTGTTATKKPVAAKKSTKKLFKTAATKGAPSPPAASPTSTVAPAPAPTADTTKETPAPAETPKGDEK
jgi:hypothetical protein